MQVTPIQADLTSFAITVKLPCGHTIPLTHNEVNAGQMIERVCLCGVKRSMIPIPDSVLEIIDSYTRNEPGKVLVLLIP
jgi:hypothetical protein